MANKTPLVPLGSGRISSTLEITTSWYIVPVESFTTISCSTLGIKPVIEQLKDDSLEYELKQPV